MRIGIFGGSFDPIHYGHLILAELCREQCELDEVRLVPAAIPPHKQGKNRAPDQLRWEMLQLAIGGHPQLVGWDFELERGGVSYTVDTLEHLNKQQPSDEVFFLMGADSLADLSTWRQPERICELANIVVMNRPNSGPVDFQVLSGVTSQQRINEFQSQAVNMPLIEISSSDLRSRISRGQSIRFQTPRAVEQFIANAGLYTEA